MDVPHQSGLAGRLSRRPQIIDHKTDAIDNRYRIVNEQDIREGVLQAQAYPATQALGHETDQDVA